MFGEAEITATLELIKQDLLSFGIQSEKRISINFEDRYFTDYTDAKSFYKFLKTKIDSIHKPVYLFLDKIQKVADWEKCINSLRISSKVDIYITGSNAKLLSGEYGTLLSGRYIEIPIYPFLFRNIIRLQNFTPMRRVSSIDSGNRQEVTDENRNTPF